MTTLFSKIMEFLKINNYEHSLQDHQPVYTSKQASKVSQHKENEGTKTLALQAKDQIIVITIPGNERIDYKQICKLIKAKKVKMCDQKIISDILESEVGGIAPFGYSKEITIIVSAKLFKLEKIYLNPGINNKTLELSGKTFKEIMKQANAIIIE